jgi:hypothetical protein
MSNLFRRGILVSALLSLCVFASAQAGGTWHRTTYFSFSVPVALPGVGLAPGTYIFELAEPSTDPSLVRVLSRDRSTVYLMALTEMIAKPPNRGSRSFVTFGEAPAGHPIPMTAWYPPDTGSGRQFIYREPARQFGDQAE